MHMHIYIYIYTYICNDPFAVHWCWCALMFLVHT